MSIQDIEQRVERSKELFHQGYNCSQAVFASCADLYGVDEETALKVSASFGGGIGRMRLVCGAASGMFLLEGLRSGSTTKGDHEGKARNYAAVQGLAERFKQEHGSLICAELLGLKQPEGSPVPEQRTPTYYQKRPCPEMVANAVRIFLTTNNE